MYAYMYIYTHMIEVNNDMSHVCITYNNNNYNTTTTNNSNNDNDAI